MVRVMGAGAGWHWVQVVVAVAAEVGLVEGERGLEGPGKGAWKGAIRGPGGKKTAQNHAGHRANHRTDKDLPGLTRTSDQIQPDRSSPPASAASPSPWLNLLKAPPFWQFKGWLALPSFLTVAISCVPAILFHSPGPLRMGI